MNDFPGRNSRSLNIFGEYEDEEERYVPAPCYSIPVTDELRAQDAAAAVAREAQVASAWTIKASLSEANLLTARRKVAAGRVEGRRQIVTRAKTRTRKPAREPKPTKPQKPNRTAKEPTMPKSTIPVFKSATPVEISTITHLEAGHGPRNVFQTLFADLCACDAEHALPITFTQVADGLLVCKRVGFIAGHKGKKLSSRRSEDGLTFYLWLTDKAA